MEISYEQMIKYVAGTSVYETKTKRFLKIHDYNVGRISLISVLFQKSAEIVMKDVIKEFNKKFKK